MFIKNIKKTWNILFRSTHPDNEWLQRLFFVTLILILVLFVKYYLPESVKKKLFPFQKTKQEGFEQREPFVLQFQNDAYDSFYKDVYEVLHPNDQIFMKNFVKYIINETQPSKEKSTFLDIGCGMGYLLDEFDKRGYMVAGVDVSQSMAEANKINTENHENHTHKNYKIKIANVLSSPNFYEEDDFSHIFCIGPTTLYEICSTSHNVNGQKPSNIQIRENLKRLIKNAQKWLRRGGYFIVQIESLEDLSDWVEETGGKTTYYPFYKKVTHPEMNYTQIDFSDVEYTISFTPPLPYFPSTNLLTKTKTQSNPALDYYEDDHGLKPVIEETSHCAPCGVVKETFVNKTTNKVRENEWHLYSPFENTEDLVRYVIKQGFGLSKAMSVTNLAGKTPRIYLFQKI